MSIATLKKKTLHKYNNNSVGQKQFSINGTHRSQGYVGQTSLSRSLPKTAMRGNVAQGYGGCCGKYLLVPSVISAVTSLNDPMVVKSSVVGNMGMLMTKYRWIRRPQPFSMTKSSSMNNLNTQSILTANKARITLENFKKCSEASYINGVYSKNTSAISGCSNDACRNLPGFKNNNYNIMNSTNHKRCRFSKPDKFISISEKNIKTHSACSSLDKIDTPSNICKEPMIGNT